MADPPNGVIRMRRVALGILLALFAVFLVTSLVPDAPVWVRFIRAMAEAGMVGGLADWFAVEALFRHPLRIPIPHTALLPRNQKRAADSIAHFIDEHFLVPDQILEKLQELDPVAAVSRWAARRENAMILGQELAWLVRLVLRAQSDNELSDRAKSKLKLLLMDTLKSAPISDGIAQMMNGALDKEVMDGILSRVHRVVKENRNLIDDVVADNSRWWIASGVDRRIGTLLIDALLGLLEDLADGNTDLRKRFDGTTANIIKEFQRDGTLDGLIDHGLEHLSGSAQFDQALSELPGHVFRNLDRQMSEDPEMARAILADLVQSVAQKIQDHPEIAADLSRRAEQVLLHLLDELRPAVRAYVSQTVAQWDSDDLVARLESEVGRDLQFIRINGSILGAGIGGLLFVFGMLLHS